MALRMEERFPIADILEQTPAIPANCQWALFLRNHDELTLEMVTDEERDYMYRVYARDKEARINLGIRRRLAPLVDNDRRKVELLHMLLFSLPGTPVIYYGDEIGMGDNMFLGDRNGVRTPMQWGPDRNAGFSSTNPQRLFLPVIQDPEYHYETVNVENQERNLSSLLWWMRRRLALRQRFAAFGSGSLEFLHPDNAKVLCFLRRQGDQNILVAVNLSASPQVTTLDLAEYAGQGVEEISSLSRFPGITSAPYPLMLAPYGYYWLLLKPALEPAMGLEAERALRMVPGNWSDVLEGRGRDALENEVLPAYLPRCRWFGGKGRSILRVDIQDRVLPPDGSEWALLFLRVEYMDGSPETYMLPLARAEGLEAKAIREQAPSSILAEVGENGDDAGSAGGEAILFEAVHNAGFRSQIMRLIATGGAWAGLSGVLRGQPRQDAFKDPLAEGIESHVLKAEQSNTSIIFPGRFFVKFLRRVEEGENPELEILRFLDENTGFRNAPPYAGALEYAAGANAIYSIAIAEGLVAHEQDAWSHALQAAGRHIGRLMENRSQLGALPKAAKGFGAGNVSATQARAVPSPETKSAGSESPAGSASLDTLDGSAHEFARLLGRRTAEMHLALASRSDLPAFAPEPFSRLYQRSLYQSMRNQVGRVFESLAKALPRLPEERRELGRKVLDGRPRVLEAFAGLLEKLIPTIKIRVHGDYHLGQVLFTGKDVVILDFEGEPARSLSERKLKRSPCKDVAGMIRSFHYAIHSAWPQPLILREEERKALEPWAELWPERMTSEFLGAYLESAGAASFVPEPKDWDVLMRAYLMEKAVYELGYELNNRPAWAHIPMLGILRLLPG